MDRLRALRVERGFTQKQVAEMLGIDRTTYAKYEAGANEPGIAMIKRLAEAFGVTTDYLLELTDDPGDEATLASFAVTGGAPLDALSEAEKAELLDFAKFLLSKRKR